MGGDAEAVGWGCPDVSIKALRPTAVTPPLAIDLIILPRPQHGGEGGGQANQEANPRTNSQGSKQEVVTSRRRCFRPFGWLLPMLPLEALRGTAG